MHIQSRLSVVIALVVALGGCGFGKPPLRTSRLSIERSGAYVTAIVAGKPTPLLLDTGSGDNMLPRSLVRARGLRTYGNDRFYVDALGYIVRVRRLPGVPVLFEGQTAAASLDFLENPTDDVPVLAVHTLLRRGWAMVIDLEAKELRFDPEEVALARARERATLREIPYHRCTLQGGPADEHRVVSVEVNGVETDMLIDTGATHTMLARDNPALPTMLSAEGTLGGMSAMFSDGRALRLDNVPVRFAGASLSVPAVVMPSPSRCYQGALGTDLLRHCTIVWGYGSLWAACAETEAASDGGAPGPGRLGGGAGE